jgi:hypothetical protein
VPNGLYLRPSETWDNAVAGGQGDNVTTTGGPEHSLVDPAPSNESVNDPVVLDNESALPGDDIVVEPDRPESHRRRRARTLTVIVVVALLAAVGIAIAIATRGGADGKTKVTSSAPVNPPPANPSVKKASNTGPRKTTPKKPTGNVTKPTAKVITPVVPISPPNAVAPQAPASVAPTAATAPPTMPPSSPPSVLQWTTTPSAISMKAGGSAFLTVTVVNPTTGNVTLGHPMSCAPTLKPLHGSPIGGAVCVEMAQILGPHEQVVAHYTIYATDTADASGAPLTSGAYVVNIENLHDVKVTVTAS